MKKILILIGTLNSGGSERVATFLANSLAKKGYDVNLAVLIDSSRCFYPLDERVKITDLTSCKKNPLKIISKLRKIDKTENFDSIIAFFFKFGAIAKIAFPNKNIICREGGDPKNPNRNKTIQKICSLIVSKCNSIVFQTNWEKSCYSKSIQKKAIVIDNPVGVLARRTDEESNQIVTAGRLCEVKNQEELIKAFKIVKSDYHNLELHIYGDGELKKQLLASIDELDLQDAVFIHDAINDLHEKIKNSKIFILPSKNEGMPNSLIEAMLIGIPCICRDFNGSDEVIKNGVNGVIYSSNGDSIQNLATSILSLLQNKDRMLKIGEEGKKQSKRYDPDLILNRWEKLL